MPGAGGDDEYVLGFTFLLVKDLVNTKYGKNKWLDIMSKGGVVDDFLTHNKYPLDVFNKLAKSCCEVLKLSIDEMLEITGYWFYFYAQNRGYKDIMEMAGKSLPELIQNLNKIHVHVRAQFAKTNTPSIWATDISSDSMVVHFIPSHRSRLGWTPFLIGIIISIAENHYNLRAITTKVLERATEGARHDRILVTWEERARSSSLSNSATSLPTMPLNHSFSTSTSSLSCPFALSLPALSIPSSPHPPSPSAPSSPTAPSTPSALSSRSNTSDSGEKITYQYGLSPDIFASAFPFHLVFGRDLTIKQMGKSIASLLPFASVGDQIGSVFSIEVPAHTPWDFDKIRRRTESLFVLQFELHFDTIRKVHMHGQMAFTKSPDNEELIYFLGSVDARNPEEASFLGLSMSSYALHDARIDMIFSATSTKSVEVDKEMLKKEMQELRGRTSSLGSKDKPQVSLFRKLFHSNSSSHATDAPSADSDYSSTTRKLMMNDFDKQPPNAMERQEIITMFRSNNNHEMYIAAGKFICSFFQNNRDDGQVEKFASELIDADCIMRLLQFLDKNTKCQVYVPIHPEDVEIGEVLGSGGLANVYHAKYQGRAVAAKVLKSKVLVPHEMSDFRREISLMTILRHTNLMHSLGGYIPAAFDPGVLPPMLIMPVMQSTLYENLRDPSIKYTWNDKINILKCIAEGMAFLHKCAILHRDLKSMNCLVNNPTDVKLTDFGLSRVKGNNMTKAVGTISWMAPEVLFGQAYSFSADVYSFGIILWEVLTGKEPYYDQTDKDLYTYIRKGGRPTLPKKPTHVQRPVIKLIEKYWQTNLKKRGTFEEIVENLKQLEKEITS